MKIHRTSALLLAAALFAALPYLRIHAQMVSPSIDTPGEPFSYYSAPTDEIGMMDAEAATEITPEGYLRTGYGELMFFAGPEYTPTNVRIRTLEGGHLPVILYHFTRDGVVYDFTMFAATLDGRPEGRLVNFIRISMHNPGAEANRAILLTGMRYDAPNNTGAQLHGNNRFDRPAEGKHPGDYRQVGVRFNPDWVYSFTQGRFLRDGQLLYTFPEGFVNRGWTLYGRYNSKQDVSQPEKLTVDPTVPVGIVTYSKLLKPGESYTLDFKMPVEPTSDAAAVQAIDAAGFDDFHAKTVAFWNQILARGMQVTLPERKATDTFYANLIYDLIAIDHLGPNYIQTVNKLHYHSFFLRDGADIVHSYDVTGYPDIAKEDLDFFALSQKADGNFLSQEQQYDGWGEAVWGYAQHYRITHDKAFAEWALPQIDRAVDWLKQARAADPLHIMPSSDVRDNEFVPGHLTGYNFLALDGLRLAIQMANETGHPDLAKNWQAEYDDYHAAFFKVLDAQCAAHDGYIPPALDGQKGGYDWGNLLAVVPEPTLDPHDPRVTATLKATQAKYKEGIMTYADGEFLHHYLTIKNTMTEAIRGDQEQATKELYGLLMHTSSTQAGFEYAIIPWGDRNFQDNLAPHGWFAAEYRTLLRTMLVREAGDELHLLSVVSPEWIGKGKVIAVSQAPTYFGEVAYKLTQPADGEANLALDTHFTAAPKEIVVHLPWFVTLHAATVDGRSMQAHDGALTVPATAKEIHLRWSVNPGTPHMSYMQTVDAYKAEYARRYQILMHGQEAR
ncbi:MAG TPA: hypothetical protein VFU68_00345 [Terracidiphilus sp.]|nr:hypothetical protein [Terracidiphilus sp.]